MLGVAVALASVIPGPIRDPLLALVTAVAAGMVLAAAIDHARRAFPASHRDTQRAATLLGVAGVVIAVAFAIQLEAIRIAGGRPAFTWIIDWRWALNHARAIARSGGVEHALDYAGAGLDYHVGPAWVAAALDRLAGIPPEATLFGIMPLLCVLALALAGVALLAEFGVPRRLAAAALALSLLVPQPHLPAVDAAYSLPGALLEPTSWPNLPVALMLNSQLALAVGACSLALLVDRRARWATLLAGGAGLASVVQIKPQYFVGFGLVAGVLGIARLLGVDRSASRRWGMPAAAALALGLALAALAVLPGDLAVLQRPRWASAARGRLQEWDAASTLLALVALGAWTITRRRRAHGADSPMVLAAAAAIPIALVAAALHFLDFPIHGDVLLRAQALQLNDVSPIYLERDLAQSFLPPRLLLLLSAFGTLAVVAAEGRRSWAILTGLAALVIVASPLPLLVSGFVSPNERYAVAEDEDLRQVLAQVPLDHSLSVASDLADPAQDHRRPLRGVLLTAYHGHRFYVSNLRYVHYARLDAVARHRALLAFFSAPWSGWHVEWLASVGVTHVLVHDRCEPPWIGEPDLPLDELARSGAWRVFASRAHARPGETRIGMPPFEPLAARYGRSECLTGSHRPGK